MSESLDREEQQNYTVVIQADLCNISESDCPPTNCMTANSQDRMDVLDVRSRGKFSLLHILYYYIIINRLWSET